MEVFGSARPSLASLSLSISLTASMAEALKLATSQGRPTTTHGGSISRLFSSQPVASLPLSSSRLFLSLSPRLGQGHVMAVGFGGRLWVMEVVGMVGDLAVGLGL